MSDESTGLQKRKRRKRLPPDTVKLARKLLSSGEHTTIEVAELLQLPYFTVYSLQRGYIYKDAGGPIKEERQRTYVSPERRAKVRALRAKGASVLRLATASGLSETTIKRILRTTEGDE